MSRLRVALLATADCARFAKAMTGNVALGMPAASNTVRQFDVNHRSVCVAA